MNGTTILLRVPVPWVFVLAYLAGVALQQVVPVPVHSERILQGSRVAGIVLFIAGAGLAAWCLGLFRTARTTTVPGQESSALVTLGPYRFTRNPMYLSLIVAYLGEAGILAQLWPLVILPLVVFYVDRVVIPVEEARLQQRFPDAYEKYCLRVRRWV